MKVSLFLWLCFLPLLGGGVLAKNGKKGKKEKDTCPSVSNEMSDEEFRLILQGLLSSTGVGSEDYSLLEQSDVIFALQEAMTLVYETTEKEATDDDERLLQRRCSSSGPLPEYNPAQDPFLGPNPLNNMHGDSGLSDTTNFAAPSDTDTTLLRYLQTGTQCYTTAFNAAADRVVLLCHTFPFIDCRQPTAECSNVTGTQLRLVSRSTDTACWNDITCDPFETLDIITLSGLGRQAGIYFYIDNNDVAVVADDKVLRFYPVGSNSLNLTAIQSIDLTEYMVSDDDQITSAFPGWNGLVWWESNAGKVGTINMETGDIGVWEPPQGIDLDQCPGVNCPTGIVKGIAVDESGTYVVTNSMLAKFQASIGAETPTLLWSYEYDRGSALYAYLGEPTGMKPGMQSWGSGTSAKLFGVQEDYVGIANNADVQIAINVVNRQTGELVCELPIFEANMSATTTSFVGYENTLFGVNNYGMEPGISIPSAPGFFRVDVEPRRSGGYECVEQWYQDDQTNTGCLKFSTKEAMVYNNINEYSPELQAAVNVAIGLLDEKGLQNLVPLLEYIANFFSENYVLARDYESACVSYKYDLNNGRSYKGFTLGEINGWTYFVSNQIGPAGELYVGTLGAMKVLYDPSS